MPLTQFNKKNTATLRSEMNDALQAVAQKYGITISLGKMQFDVDNLKCPINGELELPEEVKTARDKEVWDLYTQDNYYLEKDHFGREFESDGKKYKVVGYDPCSPKNCVKLLRLTDNRKMKCSVANLHEQFRRIGF